MVNFKGGKRNVQGDYISIYGVREGIGNGETITSGGGSFELGSLAQVTLAICTWRYGLRKLLLGLWYGHPTRKFHSLIHQEF